MEKGSFWRSPAEGKPMGRRERKKLETGRRIYRAAMELFREKGFDATTIDEIARKADVAKGTVFNYFPQKSAFLTASYQVWFARMMEDLGPPESWKGGARARLHRIFAYLTDLSVEHRELSRFVIFENMRQAHLRLDRQTDETGTLPPRVDVEAPGQEGILLLEGLVRDIIRTGKDEAEIRDEVDEGQAASLIAGMAFHTLVRWLVKGGSAREMKEALAGKLDIIITGLAP